MSFQVDERTPVDNVVPSDFMRVLEVGGKPRVEPDQCPVDLLIFRLGQVFALAKGCNFAKSPHSATSRSAR